MVSERSPTTGPEQDHDAYTGAEATHFLGPYGSATRDRSPCFLSAFLCDASSALPAQALLIDTARPSRSLPAAPQYRLEVMTAEGRFIEPDYSRSRY